jgi:spore coat protein CotH
MARLNLKSMYNDPSQMREALAWRLFAAAGVPSPEHTYVKLAINGAYCGLHSLIEQIDSNLRLPKTSSVQVKRRVRTR